MRLLETADRHRFPRMTTAELRESFLITDLFRPGSLDLVYTDQDRAVIGSAVPLATPLTLPTDDALKADYFTERRELGVLNIGGPGTVTVGDSAYSLAPLDALYIGRGNPSVSYASQNPAHPAEFYLLSYPSHAAWPTQLIRSALQPATQLGSAETANQRAITRLIHLGGVRSSQLVMGFTQLAPGSVWNTMPPHTHMRRSEVYLYFHLPAGERVLHLMGPASETRHLVVADKQVILSPGWSIHAGSGTASYSFSWGMGGENQAYDDMDKLAIADLL